MQKLFFAMAALGLLGLAAGVGYCVWCLAAAA